MPGTTATESDDRDDATETDGANKPGGTTKRGNAAKHDTVTKRDTTAKHNTTNRHDAAEETGFTSHQQREELLNSLYFDSINDRQNEIEGALSETCQWLLSVPEYVDWLNDDKLIEHHAVKLERHKIF